jgi:hypothetical protein
MRPSSIGRILLLSEESFTYRKVEESSFQLPVVAGS